MAVAIQILRQGEVVQTLELKDGSYKIGRTSDCDIRLSSREVSKAHALLIVKDSRAAILDTGSANGVFINGVLVKKERIREGDDVAVADFKIVVGNPPPASEAPSEGAPPGGDFGGGDLGFGNLAEDMNIQPDFSMPEEGGEIDHAHEVSPQEKLLAVMDEKVLVPLYGVMKKVDWRVLLSGVLIFALVMSVLLSVVPILRWGKGIATAEALNRAHTILEQLVRENNRIIRAKSDYTTLTVEAAEAANGVISAYIINPRDKSIYAPAKLFNKTVTDIYYLLAIKKVKSGERIVSIERNDSIYVVAQPIYVYSRKDRQDTLVAIALAEFKVPDGVTATLEPLVEAALFSIFLSLLAYYVILKMVTYPISKMQEQLDSAMKGEATSVECESKFPELEGLARDINFSISRWKQLEGNENQAIDITDTETEDNAYIASLDEWDQVGSDAILAVDTEKKICMVGHAMQELIGLNPQYVMGQNISDACKDPTFAGTAIELVDRVIQNFGESQTADLEINGIPRHMSAVGHKNSTGDLRYVLVAVKIGE